MLLLFFILIGNDGGVAVASAGPYANHSSPDREACHASLLSFYRSDALPYAKPTASKHSKANKCHVRSTVTESLVL